MKTGRNDPCPCGSGKKFKQCCQHRQNAATHTEKSGTDAAIQQSLQMAVEHHQSGRLPQAEAIYRQILQMVPNQPDALHLLGMAAHQTGRNDLAVELITKAISINPTGPMYYNLGNVFREQGKPDAAAENFQKALTLKPDYANAYLNLGAVLKEQGKLDAAAENFRKVLKLAPGFADAYLHLGNVLQAQGKPDAAVEIFREALKLRPDYVEARINLGNILKSQGRLDEAVESLRKVVALKPDYAEAYNNLGNALLAQEKLDEATGNFRKALALKPDYAGAHNNLGNALKEQGKLEEAITCYRQSLALNPDFAETHGNLGNALKDQGKLDAAVDCYRRTLALNPDFVDAYLNLGDALREQGKLDEAIENLNKALTLSPDCAEAHIGLGGAHQDTGQFATAEIHFEQALALKPDHPAAWAILASLRKMTLDDTPWAEKAQSLLKDRLKPQDEMKLCYALGKYHDDTRQYDAAFACYERASHIKRQATPPFDRSDFRHLVDAIISAHPPEAVQPAQTGSRDSRRPLFIVGMPRSGTSLTEQILASHPDVFGAGELNFWGTQALANLPTMRSWHRDAPMLQSIASQCEAELLHHSASALRVVDKMPGNFLHLGLIHAVFPQARILHMQRNPVDTCLSIYFQNLSREHHYANDLDDLAFYYREYLRLMAHWRRVLPPDVFLDVPYEALVEDQEGWSRKIIGFIGLEWADQCRDFHATKRRVGTASNWQVRQKIYQTSKERWRNYEKFVGPLMPLLELS